MKYSAIISDDQKCRYQLTRIWSALPILVWMMLNPSKADAYKNDATIRRCIGFSMNWGFGGLEVYNAFGYRATHPAALLEVSDPVGPENDKYLQAIPVDREIIVAWGVFPQRLAKREKNVLMMLDGRNVCCLGYTLTGYPRHPVRLPYSTQREAVLFPEHTRTTGGSQ